MDDVVDTPEQAAADDWPGWQAAVAGVIVTRLEVARDEVVRADFGMVAVNAGLIGIPQSTRPQERVIGREARFPTWPPG